MIKVDLITGFLGSGKTSFIKKYASWLMSQGIRVGILENDYGAVNVDMLLLQDLRGDMCELEMVAGGCGADCHARRFKTKLISMAMSGYNRVIIEPSGIFDMDEFFDTLRDEPLDRWYEIGSVITVVDANQCEDTSKESEYIFASQLANAGTVILSKTDITDLDKIDSTKSLINKVSDELNLKRPLSNLIIDKPVDTFEDDDWKVVANAGFQHADYVKKYKVMEAGYNTLYFLNHGLGVQGVRELVGRLFSDESFGQVLRVKGFSLENNNWYQINATANEIQTEEIAEGQDVLIVIGHNLNEGLVKSYFT